MKRMMASFGVLIIPVALLCAQNYYNRPSQSIPAQHAWIFNKQELEKILVQYLKNLGTNVPNGKIELNGLENHYDWGNNQRIELIVREK